MTPQFDTLTPQQKRVAVARDVIASMEAGLFKPLHGNGNFVLLAIDNPPSGEFQDMIPSLKAETCTVCALGSALVSLVKFTDNFANHNFEKRYTPKSGFTLHPPVVFEKLQDIFSEDEIKKIEIAFENGFGYFSPRTYSEMEARNFCKNVSDSEVRLRMIMENIIKNEGEFIPEERPA